ncbi:MAG: carbohydrate-binding domain-containing protein [Lachnospiraceae bacterium]|nr:carbohydrate-binding domain-containing protein [Lachnospiraceae bacterium]
MIKRRVFYTSMAFLLAMTTACGNVTATTTVNSFVESETSTETPLASTTGTVTNLSVSTENVTASATGEYKDSDEYVDYTTKECTYIGLNEDSANITGKKAGKVTVENGVITITEKGYYVLEGTFKGSIVIDAPEDEKVHLVLNGVTITTEDGSAIYEKNSDKLIVMLVSGTVNTLTDGSNYSDTSDEAADACLYATNDLTINGEGTLNVTGNYKAGIKTKDDLKIMSGTLNISAEDDAVKGHDSLTIAGGFITVMAGDDGLHSDGDVIVDNGTINVLKSVEAVEGLTITVNGGTINTISTDDGFNATSGNSSGFGGGFGGGFPGGDFKGDGNFNGGERPEMPQSGERPEMPDLSNMPTPPDGAEMPDLSNSTAAGNVDSTSDPESSETTDSVTPTITINGGVIYVNSGGDGLDANGNIEMNGGYVYVSGTNNDGNNATDYDGTCLMNGGNLIATGSSGMYQSISAGSGCYAIDYTESTVSEGTECVLKDGDTVLYTFTVAKNANAILITGDKLENGKEYTLVLGSESKTVTASEGSGRGGFGGNFGGKR